MTYKLLNATSALIRAHQAAFVPNAAVAVKSADFKTGNRDMGIAIKSTRLSKGPQ